MSKEKLPEWVNRDGYPMLYISRNYKYMVYEITFNDGTKYLGKKKLISERELDCLKNGKKREGHIEFVKRNRNGKRVKRERVRKQSNWKDYTGSFDRDYFEDNSVKYRVVLGLLEEKKAATYLEDKLISKYDAIFREDYRNHNLGGCYYPGEFSDSDKAIIVSL
jgi:hypothetical protein